MRLLCILLLATLLAACSAREPRPVDRVALSCRPEPTSAYDDVETAVHEEVNGHRRAAGLPELTFDPLLAHVARQHSLAMAGGERGFGHDGLDRRLVVLSGCLKLIEIHENVARMPRRRAAVANASVAGWIESPPHRANILGSSTMSGVGVVRDRNGWYYVTQLYARTF